MVPPKAFPNPIGAPADMLIDAEFLFSDRLERARSLFLDAAYEGPAADPARVERNFGYRFISPGVYLAGPNGGKALDPVLDTERLRSRDFQVDRRMDGVADDVDQVMAHVDPDALPFPCCVVLTAVTAAGQGEGGWRWSKWGPYIGTGRPVSEYLADEPEIAEVLVYRVLPIDPDRLAALRPSAPGRVSP